MDSYYTGLHELMMEADTWTRPSVTFEPLNLTLSDEAQGRKQAFPYSYTKR